MKNDSFFDDLGPSKPLLYFVLTKPKFPLGYYKFDEDCQEISRWCSLSISFIKFYNFLGKLFGEMF